MIKIHVLFNKILLIGISVLILGTYIVSAIENDTNNELLHRFGDNDKINKKSKCPTIGKYCPYLEIETDNQTLNSYPTDDSFISPRNPSENHGDIDRIKIKNYAINYEADPLIKFNISTIPQGTQIISAKLNLYYYTYNDTNPVGREITCHRIISNWDENTVTWNTRPDFNMEFISYDIVPSTFSWMTWYVTSDVQDFIDGDKINYGWQLMDLVVWMSSDIPQFKFRSKEYSNIEYHPYLEIEFNNDTIKFYPTDDSFISPRNPSENHGDIDRIKIKNCGSHYEADPLIKFNISTIPQGTQIISAKLNLYYYTYNDTNPVGREITCHRIISNWDENTVTWNTRPSYTADWTSHDFVPSTFSWMTWNVTSDVQDFIDGDKINYGWQLMDLDPWPWPNIPQFKFRSKEHVTNDPPLAPTINGTSHGRPKIEYDYIFNSTDPDGDPIMYYVDWGDNTTKWTEYSDSGEEITLEHTWDVDGEYIIKAKTKDINGAESSWSEFEVTIPRPRLTFNPLIYWFLERFPLLERLLSILLL